MKRARFLITALTISLILPSYALSQITGGAVAGTVRNQAGEAVAGAKVTATNSGTNQSRAVLTDEKGAYRFTSLAVGSYEVAVEAEQYASVVQQLILRLNEDAKVDFQLAVVGTSVETSVVEASRPSTETGNSVLGVVIDNKQITDLPLNGRNFLQLGTLAANVNTTATLRSGAEGGASNGPFAVSGQRDRSLTFLVDGVENTNSLTGSLSAQVSIDAVQEFKMITNLGPAEYGNHSGGTINIVTKSGTNELHASLFDFFRHNKLNAPNYFEKIVDRPASKFINNQFGGTLSGPAIKDETFFLASYEGQRLRVGTAQFSNVPTEAERNGLFLNHATGQTVQLPVDPVSAEILKRYVPLPNASSESGNYLSTPIIRMRNDFAMAKVDHILSPDDVINARYFISDNDKFDPIILDVIRWSAGAPPTVPGFGSYQSGRTQNLAIGYTHNFSMSTVNDLRFGYNRNRSQVEPENSDRPSDLGFTGVADSIGLYDIIVPGMSQLGNTPGLPIDISLSNFHLSDSLSLLRGRHALKIGGEMRWERQSFSLFRSGTSVLSFTGAASRISPIADFVMGVPTLGLVFTRSFGGPMSQSRGGFYVQDDYQVNRRLYLNLGLRYELSTVLSSPTHALTNFSIERGFFTPGRDTDAGLYHNDLNNVAPRIGFAWSIREDGRLVLRGGYGIFYDNIANSLAAQLNINNDPDPWLKLSVAPRGPGRLAGILNPAALVGLPPSVTSYDEGLRTPYAQHFNLNLQREIGDKTIASIGYVGTKSTKLFRVRDINQAIYIPGTGANGQPLSTANPANILMRRPTQLFKLTKVPVGSIEQLETAASSIYHSLQATISKRLSRGLTVQSAYTWSKSIDDATDPYGYAGDTGAPQNSRDMRQEKGLSVFDIRHSFTAGFTYELPFRKNRWAAGWQINSMITLRSGQPFTPVLSFDPSLGGNLSSRPNNVPGAFINEDGRLLLNPALPLDPMTRIPAALIPKPGEFGTLGRNTFIGHSYKNVDVSAIKESRLGEKLRLQTRFEVFNIFNRTNFALPVRQLGDPFFGRPAKTQDVAGGVPGIGGGGPRVVQLALKFVF